MGSTTMDGSFSMSAIAASATMTTGGCVSETMRSELGALWVFSATFLPRYGSLNLQILRNQIGGTGPAKLVLQHAVNATSLCSARNLWSCADRISGWKRKRSNTEAMVSNSVGDSSSNTVATTDIKYCSPGSADRPPPTVLYLPSRRQAV